MSRMVEKSFQGHRFWVVDPKSHEHGSYEFEDEMFVKTRYWSDISPGEIVIDIGASWGGYSLPALAQGARVIAFEPASHCASELSESVRANGWSDRCVISGDFLGDGESSSIPYWFGDWVVKPLSIDNIKQTRLDDFIAALGNPKISRLKSDIEGMEVAMLRGAKALIERDHPLLLIEDHTTTNVPGLSDNNERLCRLLREYGYSDVTTVHPPHGWVAGAFDPQFVIARWRNTMKTVTIPGPMGPFLIPAEPQNTREHAEWISKMVWDGEYSHPDIPRDGIRSILDIGAHCGSFAVLCRHQYGKDVVIDCYEPNPHACEMLKDNAPGVRVHCVAVTSDPDPLYELPWDWGSAKTWGIKNAPAYGERFKVPALHPRDLPAADMIKVDAEGVEVEVMANYAHFSGLKALIYEFHTLEHKATLAELAKARGFRCLREESEKSYGSSLWVSA